MWKRRDREEEQPIRGTSAPVPEPLKEGIPISSVPAVRSYEQETPRGVATIGKAVYIKGQIVAREDLLVDGQIEGTVEALEHRITIGPNGRVAASMKARHIIIQGQVNGNVEGSEKVEIRNGARLQGDVRTVKFVCEEEGTINGSVASLRPEPKPAPAVEAKEPAAAPAPRNNTPSEPKK
jgi:cytoskeletal protein CcmA (bactofilin family)